MTSNEFISRINWKHVLIHTVAFWFFIYAAYAFSFLSDTKLVDAVRHSNEKEIIANLNHYGDTTPAFVNFLLWNSISGFIGLIIGFIASLIISKKKNLFWFNSLLALIITYFLYKFNFLGIAHLRSVFWYTGLLFNNSFFEFSVNGLVLLTIGFLILYLKRINNFIGVE